MILKKCLAKVFLVLSFVIIFPGCTYHKWAPDKQEAPDQVFKGDNNTGVTKSPGAQVDKK